MTRRVGGSTRAFERIPSKMPDEKAPFWRTKAMAEMTKKEWESLCDGCGRCCLNKLTDVGIDGGAGVDVGQLVEAAAAAAVAQALPLLLGHVRHGLGAPERGFFVGHFQRNPLERPCSPSDPARPAGKLRNLALFHRNLRSPWRALTGRGIGSVGADRLNCRFAAPPPACLKERHSLARPVPRGLATEPQEAAARARRLGRLQPVPLGVWHARGLGAVFDVYGQVSRCL